MVDLRRIPVAACLLLVALRMSIGWQFLYEGLWKIDSQSTAHPWSAEGYLRNAQGPFRNLFRNMTGDPDEKCWLDHDAMLARWNDWRQRFVAHFELDDAQQQQLDVLFDGPAEFSVPLAKLPASVSIKGELAKSVRYDADGKRLVADGKRHLVPKERDDLLKMVADDDSKEAAAFMKAVDELYKRSAKLSYAERLTASLKGDPTRAGLILEEQQGTVDFKRMGEIELYFTSLQRYDDLRKTADTDFKKKHLERTWAELQELKGRVVGPVRALERDLHTDGMKLLTAEQMARGPIAAGHSEVDHIDAMTIWSLLILGGLLLAGLATRLAAVLGAAMLVMFYLPMPPWPGVPEAPGPEHSLIINKNLIEAIALLAIAAMPTGQWFGMDRWFQKLFYGRKDRAAAKSETTGAPSNGAVPSTQRATTTSKT